MPEPINGNEPKSQPVTYFPSIAPSRMSPQPVPTEFSVVGVRAQDGRNLVALQLVTGQGVQIYFFDEASAKNLEDLFARCRTGIIVAT